MAYWTFNIKFPYDTQFIFRSLMFATGEDKNLELLTRDQCKTSCVGIWNISILPDRSIYIRHGLLSFESSCRVVPSLRHDISEMSNQKNHPPVFGWSIELLIFMRNS
jgi:hypothetical protein